jgi:hypothetical protein
MNNRDILILIAIGALAYLYINGKKVNTSSSSAASKANPNTLPPLPKKMVETQEMIIMQDESNQNDGYDKFGINIIDPKFGHEFFQHGVSLC